MGLRLNMLRGTPLFVTLLLKGAASFNSAPPVCEKAVRVVQTVYVRWAATLSVTDLTAENIVVDATGGNGYDWQYADGFKEYYGHVGWQAWMDYLYVTLAYPSYQILNLPAFDMRDGYVVVYTNATMQNVKTGKIGSPAVDTTGWFVNAECKISEAYFTWGGREAMIDELYNPL